ncbi:polyprenyl synthetase family protein [Opitutus terrae]|uniref:Polyprenyl synthetase n=1 Tax=Opitutus terrae (strain DSM 11246 / JCM 15787 / PB90-1) TaxID=452637 RepID=B1ZSK3_OPITP|nr:polyprenyl synthetase family protein [Opitutus terrae]ACB73860.1 Polyprenyl synthetase [Opitutus terrae PB90-1]
MRLVALPALRARLLDALDRHLPTHAHAEPSLRAALRQLASHPGKLVRAQLVLIGAEQHGWSAAAAEQLACAIEFFHVASLVLDDLPCMDNAETRRGQPCVHRRHGDATAILAALALINRAYALAGEAFLRAPRTVRRAAVTCLHRALGHAGLVGGQAWDLAFARTDRSSRTVAKIAAAKTGALFELTVLLPALAAPASGVERRWLRALCVYWGLQFQAADDLRDVLLTSVAAGKTTQRDQLMARPNLALALGVPAARHRLARLDTQIRRTLHQLNACSSRWDYLRQFHDTASALLARPVEAETVAA